MYMYVGDEQQSSEDVLSESADEIPMVDNEAAHVSDVDSPGDNTHESLEQLCAEAENFKQDSSNKGTCMTFVIYYYYIN